MLDMRNIDQSKVYIIGVSGGCDSMALLDMCYQNHLQVIVAHVNYNYRDDTQEDYDVVSNYCKNHQIPFEYYEVSNEDHHVSNFQENARLIRYKFYKSLYEKYNASGVLLAHHKDDVVETIYMHFDRGSISSYLGIKEVSKIMDMIVIRPLLACYKEDLKNYCLNHHILYHDDYTNFETDFTRDYVRNKILINYSKQEKEELMNKANLHNEKMRVADEKIKASLDTYKKEGSISYSSINKEDLNHFLYNMLLEYIEPKLITHSLIEEIKKQCESSIPNIKMNLPVNFMFIKEYDNVHIQLYTDKIEYCYTFEKLEEFTCPHFSLSFEGHLNEGVYLSEDDFPIQIRTLRHGDVMKCSGGSKKVKKLFIDAKIPMSERLSWPIVVNQYGVIVLIPHISKNINYLTTKPNIFVIK